MWQTPFSLLTIVCALNCIRIEIKNPSKFGEENINRKGFDSVNVQATRDAENLRALNCYFV